MLRPSSARDASTCLRCNLRLVLRQIQQRRYHSSDESPLPIREFPVTTPAPTSEQQQDRDPPPLHLSRIRANHGRIRGKKGGQRRVESSEPLSIASLGQSSEVIILRDLHEPRLEKKPFHYHQLVHHGDSAEPNPPILTAKDIENMSGRRAIRPPPTEVFESIEALRPEEGVHVLTTDDFDAKFAALEKGYNTSQLKGYLLQKTASVRHVSSHANETSRRDQRKIEPTEISSRDGTLQDLKRTAWHAGTTPITKRLPMTVSAMHMGRKMNNKDRVIDSILRHAWALSVEEEASAMGEMEFLLSPMQFGLLLTKNSETLQPLLESSQFYKNSRFQLHQPDRVIRIIGPRAEAEAIAYVLAEAYVSARSADIDLETFHDAMQDNPSGFTLDETFAPAQLASIMNLTRTYIRYDVDVKRLQIASFVDTAINDAHRLLIAMLPLNKRGEFIRLYDAHDADDCRLEPVSFAKDLPSHARIRQLGRWVTSLPKLTATGEHIVANRTTLEAEKGNSVEDSLGKRAVDAHQPHTSLRRDSPIIREALEIMKDRATPPEVAARVRQTNFDFWNASIGLSLHDTQAEKAYPGASGLSVSTPNDHAQYNRQTFAPQAPGLIGLLANARMRGMPKTGQDLGILNRFQATELIANLIPSPLEQAGFLASTAFPTIQLRFYIENSRAEPKERDGAISTTLPNGKRIVFRTMCAIISTEVVQLNLPSQPADIRFEREKKYYFQDAKRNARVVSFIKAVHESMANDAVLRAPPALEVSIPQWMVDRPVKSSNQEKLKDAASSLEAQVWSEKASKSQTIPVKYLFAGFEYRESRSFDHRLLGKHHRARIHMVEAGATGGRCVALSLCDQGMQKTRAEDPAILEELVIASVKVINSLAKSQLGYDKTRSRWKHDPPEKRFESRRQDLNTTEPSRSRHEGNWSIPKPKRSNLEKTRGFSSDVEDISRGKAARPILEETLQALMTDASVSSGVEKVAEQENGLELDTDQDPCIEKVASDDVSRQGTSAIEKLKQQSNLNAEPDSRAEESVAEQSISRPESQTQVFDASMEQNHSTKLETKQPSSTETPTSTPSTTSSTTEQTSTQPSPSLETQEVKTEETKAPEAEPLSVRLKRLMSGGAS